MRAGIIASTIANVHSGKGRSFKPADFMPEFDAKPKHKQTAEDMASVMRAFTARQNAAVARGA